MLATQGSHDLPPAKLAAVNRGIRDVVLERSAADPSGTQNVGLHLQSQRRVVQELSHGRATSTMLMHKHQGPCL